jgi:acetoin utilization deacetylase AcuC-like enzyme
MGLDTYDGDAVAVSQGGFKLSGNDYYEIGKFMGSYVKDKFIPTVFVQEGGYKMDVVGEAAADVVGGFSAGAV